MKRHFVKFYSPGTLVSEITTKQIECWNIIRAQKMAKDIKERYGATPYGFRFITKGRKPNELDSKVVDKSNMYYLGGTVKTLKEIKRENDPDNKILIRNMEGNGWDKVIINNNSYKCTLPLRKNDVVLNWKG